MKLREELMSMGKVQSSVQEMLAEARQIVSPSFSMPKGINSHIELYLPAAKINQHLKEILRGPSSNQKKIQRSKRYNSVSLQNYAEKQEREHSNLMAGSKRSSSKHASRSLNRYVLDSIISNVQNQLLDKRNKRSLCDKKTINLLPQLPNIPKSQAKDIKRIQAYYQKIDEWIPKHYFTITQKNSIQRSTDRYEEIQKSKTIQLKKQQQQKKQQSKGKRVKSQLLRNSDQSPDRAVKQKIIKVKIIEQNKQEVYDPQPWTQQSKKDEYFDFNNF